MASAAPVTRFNVAGFALFANFAAILAHNSVERTQYAKSRISGIPPIAKWLAAPVKAVNVIINTLVPTAVFNSYPKTLVNANAGPVSTDKTDHAAKQD